MAKIESKAQDELEKTLKEHNLPFEFYRYDADHGFTNEKNPNYNKEATELAHTRVIEFFKKQLH